MSHPEIRVALLEYQRLALESLRQLFSLNGLSVVAACGKSLEFLGAVRSTRPDLAVVDLSPSRDRLSAPEGVELIRELQRSQPEVAVIALTVSAIEAEMQSARDAGAAACLDKHSVGPDQIFATVRSILRSRSGEPLGRPESESNGLTRLTHRELQVLRHLSSGTGNLEIAARLNISERTIRAHVSSLYRKLGCVNRTEMAVLARTLGIQSYELGG